MKQKVRMTHKELAREIATMGGKIEVRTLGPELQRSVLRLVRAANDDGVIEAWNAYERACRRADLHVDTAVRQKLEKAEESLEKYLSRLGGAEEQTLRREIAHRRRALLADKEVLADQVKEAAESAAKRRAQRGAPDALDLGASLIQNSFLDGLRDSLRRLRAGAALAKRELLRLRGYRKLRSVIGKQWTEGWDEVFRYARENADSIARAERTYLAALEKLESARKASDLKALQLAETELVRAEQARSGFRSKIKGILGEAYVTRWKPWLEQRESYTEAARALAAKLPGEWDVQRFAGNLRLDGAEAWDEVILLVRKNSQPPEAKLFLAAQFKVEGRVSALKQVMEGDVIRETASLKGRQLPILTVENPGQVVPEAFALSPLPAGATTHRYVFNAAEGRISATQIAALESAGVQVHQMTLDVTLSEFNAVTDAIIEAIAKVLP